MTTTVLNRKISKLRTKYQILVTITVVNTKISEVENKVRDHAKYIATQEFNKLTSEKITAKLTQANLVSKIDFDNKLRSFNIKINSNKTKYLKVQRKAK